MTFLFLKTELCVTSSVFFCPRPPENLKRAESAIKTTEKNARSKEDAPNEQTEISFTKPNQHHCALFEKSTKKNGTNSTFIEALDPRDLPPGGVPRRVGGRRVPAGDQGSRGRRRERRRFRGFLPGDRRRALRRRPGGRAARRRAKTPQDQYLAQSRPRRHPKLLLHLLEPRSLQQLGPLVQQRPRPRQLRRRRRQCLRKSVLRRPSPAAAVRAGHHSPPRGEQQRARRPDVQLRKRS
mmetsp:Transcript_14484/g.33716  ORF Transcript_14484/g.33716 Transcript_14484/m.33716 type:complete len:238 (-) Transcript_14484:455-1168(-)